MVTRVTMQAAVSFGEPLEAAGGSCRDRARLPRHLRPPPPLPRGTLQRAIPRRFQNNLVLRDWGAPRATVGEPLRDLAPCRPAQTGTGLLGGYAMAPAVDP